MPSINMTNMRLISLDYAKALVMFLVVLGHYTYAMGIPFGETPVWRLMHTITLFHMPFFFIVSGMLFKETPVKECLRKGWVQLLRPYLLMSLIVFAIVIVRQICQGEFKLSLFVCQIIGICSAWDAPYAASLESGALWFCWALFMVKLVSCLLSTIKQGGVFVAAAFICCALYR